ncbi:TetR/AcrR family transcriptional regulator [Paenibacillus sp.]|jgi:AcrR family transcriptional regulator|uniref:TetR/AcrR family transcriptional regulator n=1 Tax=Paenibacillus sp. TaxID=58172 RepID=UPI002839B2A5|nr:TetR/AcrR family transcriptional regulator [Paenibacillus sp.]MDR0268636.1 TetR/AcrR family transcriptional regulator [Paenibacillus sp.]
MDRRTIKTREAIIEAFVGLMREKSFDKITINEIADRANVNRGTVYLHYTDKFDLLEQCIETYLQRLFEGCVPSGSMNTISPKTSLLQTLKHLEEHFFIYSTLITSKGVPAFRNRLIFIMKKGVEDQINIFGAASGVNQEITVQFLASAAVGLLEWWIVQDKPYPAEEMVDQLLLLFGRHLMLPTSEDE